MGIGKSILRLFTWWGGQTLNTQFFTWRKGVKVGEDDRGNIFYQTRDGKRRWVIYESDAEASKVSPQWHGWLHHTFDDLPTDNPLPRKSWEKSHSANSTGTAMAYAPSGSIRNASQHSESDYEAWQPE